MVITLAPMAERRLYRIAHQASPSGLSPQSVSNRTIFHGRPPVSLSETPYRSYYRGPSTETDVVRPMSRGLAATFISTS
jgi:hypothetical protein